MAGAALANVLVGLGGIGAGVGFGVKEHQLMTELNEKADKLKKDVQVATDLYDHVYYLVSVNLERLRKSVDRLPSDFVEKVQKDIDADLKSSESQKALAVLGQVLGYTGMTFGVVGGILELVRWWKNRPTLPVETGEPNPWGDIEMTGPSSQPTEPTAIPEEITTASRTPKLDKVIKGVNIAGVVFGVAGLAASIGLGAWSIKKLENAIRDVEEKKVKVSAFQKAMEKVLNEMITDADLPEKSYDQLVELAKTWKEICEKFERYSTRMSYAIQGYFKHKSLDKVREIVKKHTDPTDVPWPDDAYPLAKTLADDIRVQFDKAGVDPGFYMSDLHQCN